MLTILQQLKKAGPLRPHASSLRASTRPTLAAPQRLRRFASVASQQSQVTRDYRRTLQQSERIARDTVNLSKHKREDLSKLKVPDYAVAPERAALRIKVDRD